MEAELIEACYEGIIRNMNGGLAKDCGVRAGFHEPFDDEFGLLEEEEVAADFSEDFVVGGGGFGFRVHGVVVGQGLGRWWRARRAARWARAADLRWVVRWR